MDGRTATRSVAQPVVTAQILLYSHRMRIEMLNVIALSWLLAAAGSSNADQEPQAPTAAERPSLKGLAIVEVYQRYFEPNLFVPWTEDMLRRAAVKNGEAVLDLGCGPGIVGRTLAERPGFSGTIVGVDISQPMLDLATKLSSALPVPIEYILGDAQQLPLEDSSFDVVLSQQMFNSVPDKAKAAKELKRVLKDGGRFVVSAWTVQPQGTYIRLLSETFEKHAPGSAEAPLFPFSGNRGELEKAFKDAGLDNLEVEVVRMDTPFKEVWTSVLDDVRIFGGGIFYGPYGASKYPEFQDPAVIDRVAEDVATQLELPARGPGTLVFESIVISGTK